MFRKMRDTGCIIQGNNSPGHCFVLRDFIPMNFLKQVVIMRLQICTTSTIFVKICLEAVRDTFFQYLICDQGKKGVKY